MPTERGKHLALQKCECKYTEKNGSYIDWKASRAQVNHFHIDCVVEIHNMAWADSNVVKFQEWLVIPPMGGALVATGTLLLVVVCAWNMKKCVWFRIGAPCRGRKMLVNYEILMLQWTDGHVSRCFQFSIIRTMLICPGVIIGSRTFWRMKLFYERLSLTRNDFPQGSAFHSFVSSKCVTRSVCHGVSRELSGPTSHHQLIAAWKMIRNFVLFFFGTCRDVVHF